MSDKPRLCWCGCRQSIEGARRGTRYTPACRERVKAARRMLERKSGVRSQHHVRNVEIGGVMRPPVLHCKYCCGLASAREPGRERDDGVTVLDPCTGRCRGCGLPPGEERIERSSILSSSAGTAVEHGRHYGG